MTHNRMLRVPILVAALALSLGTFAQEPTAVTRAAKQQILKGSIASRPVVADTQAAEVAAKANAAAATTPTQPAPAAPGRVTRPGSSILKGFRAATDLSAGNTLRRGVLYHVPLPAAEERETKELATAEVAKLEPPGSVVTFPGVFRQFAEDDKEVQLKPYALVGQALRFDQAAQEFVGSIRLGVVDLFDGGEGRALSAPVTFEVLESDLATPQAVVLDKTSPPHATIQIHARNPSDPLVVRVASRFNQEGVPLTLPLSPTLFIRTDRRAIQGYGLETTKVYISSVGHPAPKGTTVQLQSDPSAHFEHSQIELSGNGTAQATLRSDATGRVRLSATAAGFADGRTDVDFTAPWRTITSSAIGGLIGGLMRMFARARPNTKLKHRLSGLIVSILAGAIVFLLYVTGVNVFPIDFLVRVGDVFVLVVSALGGWFGTALLKQFNPAKN